MACCQSFCLYPSEKPWQPKTWQDSTLSSPPGNRSIFSTFWGSIAQKTLEKKGKSTGENKKSNVDGAPNLQSSVSCRVRRCSEQALQDHSCTRWHAFHAEKSIFVILDGFGTLLWLSTQIIRLDVRASCFALCKASTQGLWARLGRSWIFGHPGAFEEHTTGTWHRDIGACAPDNCTSTKQCPFVVWLVPSLNPFLKHAIH